MKYQGILTVCSILLVTSCMQTTPPPQWPTGTQDNNKWVDLGQSVDGHFQHYLDKEHIKNLGDKIEFVAKIVDIRKSNDHSKFDYVLNEWEIDCEQKNMRLLQVKIYGENKELASVQEYKEEKQTTPILQNSIAEKQYEFVCKQ